MALSLAATPTVTPAHAYNIARDYSGQSFFDGWDFFTGDDPTHGIVDYVNQDDAVRPSLSHTFSTLAHTAAEIVQPHRS